MAIYIYIYIFFFDSVFVFSGYSLSFVSKCRSWKLYYYFWVGSVALSARALYSSLLFLLAMSMLTV